MFFKIISVLVGKDIEDSYLDFLIELGSQCAEAASHNLAILRDLSTMDRLGMYIVTIPLGKIVDILCIAKFGFWDLLHLSSGIIVASLASQLNISRPQNLIQNLPDEQLVASSRLLLSNMADAGNMAAKNHVGMVEEVERVLQSVAQNVVYPIDHGISMVSSFEMEIYDWIQSTGFGSELPASSHV